MIHDYVERLRNAGGDRPWLIAGSAVPPKRRPAAVKEGFAVLAIGTAAAQFPSDLAYVVDIETIRNHGGAILANAEAVAMPREPHEDGWASGKSLESYADEIPALRQLAAEDRLFGFDLWTGSTPSSDFVATGDYEGEEVPLRLLASAGVKMVRHLGTRAGRNASSGFESAPAVGKRSSGGGVAELRRTSGVSYGPYGYPVPARIFAGTDDEQMLGVQVLRYSIEKFSTMDVSVEPLDWKSMPVPNDPKNRSRTGFSFCRFDIPRLCGYSGRAVYADADMQVFADITDLWTLPMEHADLLYALTHPSQGRTPQTSVMLLDCEVLQWDVQEIIRGLDEERYSYKELMSDLCVVTPGRARPLLPYWWNSLEIYEPGRTSLLHYTDMMTQPWVSHDNRNGALWYACCAEAIENGFVEISEVENAIERGHVSPEIFDWIGRPAPKDYSEMKATWVAPFNRFTKPGRPEGAILVSKDKRLVGWAWDPKKPDEPIDIGVFDGEDLVLTIRCDQYGEFLARHGKGNGYHAFDLPLPETLMRPNAQRLKVQTLDKRAQIRGALTQIGP